MTLEETKRHVGYGNAIKIFNNQKHRIECISDDDLVFIEVQTGESFSEDDITRIEDDYGRT